MSYIETLDWVTEAYRSILKKNLVGIYVHGSIAMKCFHWDKSDIDFLVVVDEKLSKDSKKKLMDVIMDMNAYVPPKGLEMSVVLKKDCMDFKYPTHFDLHYSIAHRNWYLNDPEDFCDKMHGEDKDLAAHFTITRNFGITWYGQPIDKVFGPVPKEHYLDSIMEDIKNAKESIMEDTMYIVLNLCRVLAYSKEELILSKEQGGKWGFERLDKKYHNIIAQALYCYKTDIVMTFDKKEAQDYCDYMLAQLESTQK